MENEKLFFNPGYNRIIVAPLEVKSSSTNIITPIGVGVTDIIGKYENHPKQAKVMAVGNLDARYEGFYKPGDQVMLRFQAMLEFIIIKGRIYGVVAPSDILGTTTYGKDLKLDVDKEFYTKRQ